MMKKLVLLALLGLLAGACSMNKKAFRESRNVAVISFSSMDKVKNQSSLQARILSDIRITDTVLDHTGNMVRQYFFEKGHRGLKAKVVNETDVLNNPDFQEFKHTIDTSSFNELGKILFLGVTFIPADGYPVIKAQTGGRMEDAFDYLPKEIDAVLVISNQFYYVEDVNVSVGGSFGGFSTAGLHGQRVQSRLDVHMMDREGESILFRTFVGESEEKIFGNEDDKFTLNELAQQALNNSFMEMNAYLVDKVGS